MKMASFIKIALFINEHKRKEIWDLGFEVAETIRREMSDFQTSDVRRALRACGGRSFTIIYDRLF